MVTATDDVGSLRDEGEDVWPGEKKPEAAQAQLPAPPPHVPRFNGPRIVYDTGKDHGGRTAIRLTFYLWKRFHYFVLIS